jgi:hypothetical protein
MPNEALVLVAAGVLEAREKPSTYSSRHLGRQVPTIVDQVVSLTIATEYMMVMVPPRWLLCMRRRSPVAPADVPEDDADRGALVAEPETRAPLFRLAIRRPDPRWEPGAVVPLAGICAGSASNRRPQRCR